MLSIELQKHDYNNGQLQYSGFSDCEGVMRRKFVIVGCLSIYFVYSLSILCLLCVYSLFIRCLFFNHLCLSNSSLLDFQRTLCWPSLDSFSWKRPSCSSLPWRYSPTLSSERSTTRKGSFSLPLIVSSRDHSMFSAHRS